MTNHHLRPEGVDPASIIAFIAMTAIGVLIWGAATYFVLGTLFGMSVTFGQSIGIGMVLGLIYGFISK